MTRRLVLSYLAVTFLVVLALEVPLGITYAHRQRDDLTGEVERDAFALASFAEDTLEGREHTDLGRLASAYAATTGARVVIVDSKGTALADTDPPKPGERSFADRPELQQALKGRVATGARYSKTLGHGFVFVAVPSASGGVVHGAVRITFPTSAVDARVRRYWLTLAGVAAVSLAAAAAVGAVLARSVARPLSRVEEAATAMGAGDLAVRVPDDTGPGEVRALAGAFNETAGRLEELVQAQ
jgi:HAMP domain-containing protein